MRASEEFAMYRICIAASAALAVVSIAPAFAEPASRITEKVYRCAEIAADAERLACFDVAVAELRGAEESGAVRTIAAEDIEKIERESFGFSLPSIRLALRGSGSDRQSDRAERAERAERSEITEVTMPVARISSHPTSRRLTVVLQDGQTWEQIDSRQLPARTLRNPREARIRRAALGSFVMTIDDSVAIRVKRIG
jgi:antitoxin (DNA-binding transcriptional repressor) of toxin-antitoxin stability system